MIYVLCAHCVRSVTRPTNNSVFGACLLAHLHVHLLLLPLWVSVCKSEVIHFSCWILPVHIDSDFCLAKNLDIIYRRDVWKRTQVLENKVVLDVQT